MDDKTIHSDMTALHEFLGVTPEQVDWDLAMRGINPATEVASLRRLGQVLAAQFGPQAQRERAATSGSRSAIRQILTASRESVS